MLLYHYSKEKHPLLLTLEKQNKITKEERKQEEKNFVEECKKHGYIRPGYYFEHISFFFEPPPLDIISNIFPKDHPVWKKNNTLYEYIVDSRTINSFKYEVAEFPEKTKIYYDDKISDKNYHKLIKDIIISNNYIGKNSEELEVASEKFLNNTRSFFEQIKEQPNYDEIKYKYAATVPHVMLYPILGTIKPKSISQVKVL